MWLIINILIFVVGAVMFLHAKKNDSVENYDALLGAVIGLALVVIAILSGIVQIAVGG